MPRARVRVPPCAARGRGTAASGRARSPARGGRGKRRGWPSPPPRGAGKGARRRRPRGGEHEVALDAADDALPVPPRAVEEVRGGERRREVDVNEAEAAADGEGLEGLLEAQAAGAAAAHDEDVPAGQALDGEAEGAVLRGGRVARDPHEAP